MSVANDPGEDPRGNDQDSSPDLGASDDAAEQQMARMTRRAFLVGGLASIAGASGLYWLNGQRLGGWPLPVVASRDGIPSPLRRVHEANQAISQALFRDRAMVPMFAASRSAMPKVNGMDGLKDIEDGDDATPSRQEWQLRVSGVPDIAAAIAAMRAIAGEAAAKAAPDDPAAILVGFQVLAKLPKVEQVVEMKCVEGWAQVVHWGGASMADFIRLCLPGMGTDWRGALNEGSLSRYVDTRTPDEEYFVGLDIESAMHPQSLLCYEMQGSPLQPAHGAPVRVVMPMKYGYKSLKRLGSIAFTNEKPGDFWAGKGYDWYGGH